MWEAIQRVWDIVTEEAKRRGWVGVFKALFWLAGFIGFSLYALHPLVKWLFPQSVIAAWVIMISFAVVATLLVVINFMRTYHERIIKETADIWKEREEDLKIFYRLNDSGEILAERLRKLSNDELFPEAEVVYWNQSTASALEFRLGIEYRRSFYDHSETGEDFPRDPVKCGYWIDARRSKLHHVIEELKKPPVQLISHDDINQIRLASIKYRVKG